MRQVGLVVLASPDEALQDVRLLQHNRILLEVAAVEGVEICEHVVKLYTTDQS